MSVLTRIKNNQILDGSIWANSKIIAGSITGSLFNSTITTTSDITITGNLTVQGSTSYLTIASTNTYVNDPLLVLNNAYSAGAMYDIGFVFERGSDVNQAFYWDETSDEFKLIATTEAGTTYGNIGAETSYSKLRLGNLVAQYDLTTTTLTATGLINTTGNISGAVVNTGALNASGTTTLATVSTGAISATGLINTTANISGAVVNGGAINSTGLINTTGNVSGAVVNSGALNVTGVTTLGGYLNSGANISAAILHGGAINSTGLINTTGNISGAVVNSATLGVTGTATIATVSAGAISATGLINTTGNISGAVINSATTNVSGTATASVLSTGTLNATGLINTTANISGAVVNGGAINSTGLINTTGNVSAAVVNTGALNATGTTTLGAVSTGAISATGLINTTGNVSASVVNAATMNVSGTATASVLSTDTLNATGLINTTGNVSAAVHSGGAVSVTGHINTAGNVSAVQINTATLKASGLTSGRVIYTSTAGLLVDNAGMTFTANTLTVGGTQPVTVNGTTATIATTGTNQSLILSPHGTGSVDFAGSYATNLLDPVSGSDAVTLTYLNTALSSAVTNIIQDDTSIYVYDSGANGNIVVNVDADRVALITQNTTTLTNDVIVSNSTASTTTTNGALVVTGGVGIGGAATVGGQVKSTATTQSTNTTTGAMITAGGVGIAKNLNVGGDVTVTGNLTVDGTTTTINSTTMTVDDLNIVLASGAADSSAANGAGITVDGASATILYTHATTSWNLNRHLVGTSAALSSTLAVTGAATLSSTLAVTGATTLSSTLNAGASTLASASITGAATVGTTLGVTGATTLSSTLGVTGATTMAALSATTGAFSGAATLSSTLAVTGAATLSSTLAVTGATTVGGTLGVTGVTTLGAYLNSSANISAAVLHGGAINSTGLINTTGNVSAAVVNTGALNATGTTTLGVVNTGAISATGLINTTGNISGAVVNGGAINSTGAATVGGTLGVTGATTMAALSATTGTFSSTLGVSGATTLAALSATTGAFSGAATVGGTLGVTGATTMAALSATTGTFSSTLGVTGAATLSSTLGVTGATTLSSTLGVTGAATLSSTLAVTGVTQVTSAVPASTSSTGALIVTGGVGIGGNLYVGAGLQNTPVGNTTASSGAFTTLSASGAVTATATTDTSSASTGALVVTGGVGIGKTVWVGEGMVINSTQSAEALHFKGYGTDTSLVYVNPAKNAMVFGGANVTVQDGVVAKFNSTGAIQIPTGSTSQRPGAAGNVDVAGLLRFSTSSNNLEFYDGTTWTTAGSVFTVVSTNSFSGDGSTTAFTLSSASTTAATFVMINGVVQIPTTAYSVSGTTLTFTEAPASGDAVDARVIITTSTVNSLASANGFNTFDVGTANYANVTAGTSSAVTRLSIDGATGTATFTNDVVINGQLTVKGDTAGNINIGDQTTDKVQLQGTIVYNQTALSAPGAHLKQLDTYNTSAYHTSKHLVQVRDASQITSAEVMVAQDGTNVHVTTYAVLNTHPTGVLGTFSANIVSNAVYLWYTPAAHNLNANIKVQTTYIV